MWESVYDSLRLSVHYPPPHFSLFMSSLWSSVPSLARLLPQFQLLSCRLPPSLCTPLISCLANTQDWVSPATCVLGSRQWCVHSAASELPVAPQVPFISLPTASRLRAFRPLAPPVLPGVSAVLHAVDHSCPLLPFGNPLLLAFVTPPFPGSPFPILAGPFQSSVLVPPLLPDFSVRSSSRFSPLFLPSPF